MLPGVSVVIPVYRGSRTLGELLSRLAVVLDALSSAYEVILVDDGSPDDSWVVISDLAQRYRFVVGIRLNRNYGQHSALLCGIREARYDTTITMDDDLQHAPEDLPQLIGLLDKYDVAYAAPRGNEPHGIARGIASRLVKAMLSRGMGASAASHASAFRAFKTPLRDAFHQYNSSIVSIDVLLTWGTNRFGVVYVHHYPRTDGASNYTISALLSHATNMMTGFSVLPLRLASVLGASATAFGACLLAWVLGRLLVERSVPGFPFLASALTIFSGVQLLILGIIGEYLGRIHIRSMGAPPYATRERTSRGIRYTSQGLDDEGRSLDTAGEGHVK